MCEAMTALPQSPAAGLFCWLDRNPNLSLRPVMLAELREPSPRLSETAETEVRVRALLRKTPHLGGCTIVCRVHEGAVLLRGRVRTFYQKQIAQTVVAGVDGVEQIDNEIEVAPNS